MKIVGYIYSDIYIYPQFVKIIYSKKYVEKQKTSLPKIGKPVLLSGLIMQRCHFFTHVVGARVRRSG